MSAAPQLSQPFLPMLVLDEPPVPTPTRRVPVRAHLRRVTGTEPPTGKELRDAALMKHEAREATHVALLYVREQLVALSRARSASPTAPVRGVTADDVERALRDWPLCPDEAKAEHGPQHWRGTVFRAPGWRQTGQTVPSLRPHMRATQLPIWHYSEEPR